MDVLDALSRHEGVRHVTTRHEQGAAFMADVHGRLTGRARGRDGHARSGRHEPHHGCRGRVPGPRADGRDHGPGGLVQAPQGGPPGRRHRADAGARHEVEHAGRRGRAASPRSCARRSGWRRSRSPGRPTSSCPRTSRRPRSRRTRRRPCHSPRDVPTSPSRPTRPSPTPRASSRPRTRPIILAGNGILRRGAAPELRALARGLHIPVADDVHGQGRDRRSLAPLADGGRPPGARPRPLRLRPGRPRHLRRLRPRRVRAVVVGSGRLEAGHPHRHAAGRDRRRVPPRGRAHRRHRRVAAAVARRRPAARRGRPECVRAP